MRLHLLHGLGFDLADAFGGYAEFGSQVVQRRRIFVQPACFDDAPAALVKPGERRLQAFALQVIGLEFLIQEFSIAVFF